MRMPAGNWPKSNARASAWWTVILSSESRAARSRSSSMTWMFPVLERTGRVRAPSPGPISTRKSSGDGSSASMIRASTPGSCRKCCPNLLRGRCELDGKLHRLDQASGVGLAAAGEVERGAVVDRGAHERQAERDIDAAAEARVLQHRQSLVVVHGEHRVGAFQPLRHE